MRWIFCLLCFPLYATDISDYIEECFPGIQREAIGAFQLHGGLSEATSYRIDVRGHSYVLKLLPDGSAPPAKRELFAFFQASIEGIAPKMHYISADGKAVLNDFVEGEQLRIETAKKLENLIAIAHALRKAHAIPKSPYGSEELSERTDQLYALLQKGSQIPPELPLAMENKQEHPLPSDRPRATIHGDLNARNIFITQHGAELIDWGETGWEDPFYDLACFATLHNYTREEEELLLATYLEQIPTQQEWARYDLIKRAMFVDFSVSMTFLANSLSQGNPLSEGPLADWSYYTESFANNREALGAQFFYDWARCCLRSCPQKDKKEG